MAERPGRAPAGSAVRPVGAGSESTSAVGTYAHRPVLRRRRGPVRWLVNLEPALSARPHPVPGRRVDTRAGARQVPSADRRCPHPGAGVGRDLGDLGTAAGPPLAGH
jgi:hypothetical protein